MAEKIFLSSSYEIWPKVQILSENLIGSELSHLTGPKTQIDRQSRKNYG